MRITEVVKAQYEQAKFRAHLEKLELDPAIKTSVLSAKEKAKEVKEPGK